MYYKYINKNRIKCTEKNLRIRELITWQVFEIFIKCMYSICFNEVLMKF